MLQKLLIFFSQFNLISAKWHATNLTALLILFTALCSGLPPPNVLLFIPILQRCPSETNLLPSRICFHLFTFGNTHNSVQASLLVCRRSPVEQLRLPTGFHTQQCDSS